MQLQSSTFQKCSQDLGNLNPELEISVILSRGKFYIEDGTAFIRTNEALLYGGKVKNFKAEEIQKKFNHLNLKL